MYLRNWRERWAISWPQLRFGRPNIWVHAVSVGETRAAAPLIEALLQRYPDAQIVLSHGTPTGRETGRALFARFADRVVSVYLPYDYAYAGRRFIQHVRPFLGLILETEVWPNLMESVRRAGVPVALVNGRLSQKSLEKALRHPRLIGPALHGFQAIYAQSPGDAERLMQLGVSAMVVGNLKFDMQVDEYLRQLGETWRARLGRRPVILLASSRDGEERMLLEAMSGQTSGSEHDALVLIVPRHPQRFNEVAALVTEFKWGLQRRSEARAWPAGMDGALTRTVLLGDTMGELQAYYAMADVVIMGGTLAGTGGQNLIEAAALGCPVVLGPSTYNFAQASEQAIEAGAAFAAQDAAQAWQVAMRLVRDCETRNKASAAALAFTRQHTGALAATLAQIELMLLAQ
jgi:3-deoxy-D-manno-octulosonic-acid transferase